MSVIIVRSLSRRDSPRRPNQFLEILIRAGLPPPLPDPRSMSKACLTQTGFVALPNYFLGGSTA
jgi:hypothetical protein